MTAAAPGGGGYDRPPYRVPDAPARANGPGAWALDVLLPWRLARRVHGPFRVLRFSTADVVGLTAPGQPVPAPWPEVEATAGPLRPR